MVQACYVISALRSPLSALTDAPHSALTDALVSSPPAIRWVWPRRGEYLYSPAAATLAGDVGTASFAAGIAIRNGEKKMNNMTKICASCKTGTQTGRRDFFVLLYLVRNPVGLQLCNICQQRH